jgi:phosphoglycolate phosphatase-like HAD superfamily hydrolase
MIKTIILDFDGVVVESLGIKTQAFRDLFHDYPRQLEQIMSYHLAHNSISRYTKFEYIVTRILDEPYDEARKQAMGTQFSQLVCRKVIECPYVPGAEEFLRYFSSRVPLYLASASPHDELEIILKARGIDRYFKKIFGFPHKKAEVFQAVLAAEKAAPEEAVYIGDSREDYTVARETGVLFIARENEESFDGLKVPIYRDMAGMKQYVAKLLGQA